MASQLQLTTTTAHYYYSLVRLMRDRRHIFATRSRKAIVVISNKYTTRHIFTSNFLCSTVKCSIFTLSVSEQRRLSTASASVRDVVSVLTAQSQESRDTFSQRLGLVSVKCGNVLVSSWTESQRPRSRTSTARLHPWHQHSEQERLHSVIGTPVIATSGITIVKVPIPVVLPSRKYTLPR